MTSNPEAEGKRLVLRPQCAGCPKVNCTIVSRSSSSTAAFCYPECAIDHERKVKWTLAGRVRIWIILFVSKAGGHMLREDCSSERESIRKIGSWTITESLQPHVWV